MTQDKWGQGVDREATAQHEAGHAVIGIRLGESVESVDITRQAGDLGGCQFDPPPDSVWNELESIAAGIDRGCGVNHAAITPETRGWIEHSICSSQAGPIAEELYRGKKLEMNQQLATLADLDNIQTGATMLWPRAEQAQHLQESASKVEGLLAEPSVWKAVEVIAKALLEREHLPGEEVHKLYQDAIR